MYLGMRRSQASGSQKNDYVARPPHFRWSSVAAPTRQPPSRGVAATPARQSLRPNLFRRYPDFLYDYLHHPLWHRHLTGFPELGFHHHTQVRGPAQLLQGVYRPVFLASFGENGSVLGRRDFHWPDPCHAVRVGPEPDPGQMAELLSFALLSARDYSTGGLDLPVALAVPAHRRRHQHDARQRGPAPRNLSWPARSRRCGPSPS